MSGIREAYRVDLLYKPERHRHDVKFEWHEVGQQPLIYKKTFRMENKYRQIYNEKKRLEGPSDPTLMDMNGGKIPTSRELDKLLVKMAEVEEKKKEEGNVRVKRSRKKVVNFADRQSEEVRKRCAKHTRWKHADGSTPMEARR